MSSKNNTKENDNEKSRLDQLEIRVEGIESVLATLKWVFGRLIPGILGMGSLVMTIASGIWYIWVNIL